MKKIFLGGTCNNTEWRQALIPLLTIDYFDPVVEDWNEAAYIQELREREVCDYCLYTIVPTSSSVYSIAEVVDDSNKRPEKTILCLLRDDGDTLRFTDQQWKHLGAVAKMVEDIPRSSILFTD